MSRPKPTPERKSRSGSYVPDALRGARGGASERVVIRCSPELAERARKAAAGGTLADDLGKDSSEWAECARVIAEAQG